MNFFMFGYILYLSKYKYTNLIHFPNSKLSGTKIDSKYVSVSDYVTLRQAGDLSREYAAFARQ